MLLVVAPPVVAVIALASPDWVATIDHAIIVMRAREVGTAATPLVGPFSRVGWAHPGPALFYVLAPFVRVFGDRGALIGAAAVNVASAVGTVLVARRAGDRLFAALMALLLAIVMHTMGLGGLVDFWNPVVALLPFVLFLVCTWAVLTGEVAALPVAVVAGSFAAQNHVSYLSIVAVGTVVAFVAAWRAWRRPAFYGAVIALVLMWLPPVIAIVRGDEGSGITLVQSLLSPSDPPLGWSTAFDVMGAQLGLTPVWATGHETVSIGFARIGPWLPAFAVLALLVACGVLAWRRRDRLALLLCSVAGGAVVMALWVTSRISGVLFTYLLRPWWGVALVVTAAIAYTALRMLRGRALEHARVVLLVAATVVTVVTLVGVAAAKPPTAELSRVTSELVPSVARGLQRDTSYVIIPVEERGMGISADGLFVALRRRGFDVRMPEGPRDEEDRAGSRLKYGPPNVAAGDLGRYGKIYFVNLDDLDRGWTPPPSAREVARADSLSPAERAELRRLDARVRAELGSNQPAGVLALDDLFAATHALDAGVPRDEVEQVAALRRKGPGYAVFVAPPDVG